MLDTISMIYIPILGLLIFFQLRAIIPLACKIQMSMNLTYLLCKGGLIGYIPRIKSLGSSSFFDKIWSIISIIPSQKGFTFSHSHIQWYNVPFASLHFIQVSGILSLNLCNLTGVMYVRISHLYCISFKLLLTVCI